jgi:HEXXH motif-containing protein
MIRLCEVPDSLLDAFARGGGGLASTPALRAARLSRAILMVRGVIDVADRRADPLVAVAVRRAARILAAAHARRPAAVNDVLLDPHVASWAAACLTGTRPGADPRYLTPVAFAAAVRADLPVRVAVHAPAGAWTVPTLGLADVGPVGPVGPVRWAAWTGKAIVLETAEGENVVIAADAVYGRAAHSAWRARRQTTLRHRGEVWAVTVEDRDPAGVAVGRFAPTPLDETGWAAWRGSLAAGWARLVEADPFVARAMAAAVRTVVPVASPTPGTMSSGTSSYAVGAVALSRSEDGLSLGAALAHEWAHTKLDVLIMVAELTTADRAAIHYAPWRPDPRPIRSVLQGTYAHLAVCAFWWATARRDRSGVFRRAQLELAEWRGETLLACERLLESGALTERGARFVRTMAGRLRELGRPPVPQDLLATAEEIAAERRVAWRLRNLSPDGADVDRLAGAWARAAPAPRVVGEVRLTPPRLHDEGAGVSPLADRLARRRLVAIESGRALWPGPAVAGPDWDLLAGRFENATAGYSRRIAADGADVAAWVGLARAAAGAARTGAGRWLAAARSLEARPELVRAVHESVRRAGDRQTPPDPVDLAAWLAPATGGTPPHPATRTQSADLRRG